MNPARFALALTLTAAFAAFPARSQEEAPAAEEAPVASEAPATEGAAAPGIA